MITLLPRELRDIIYTMCLYEDFSFDLDKALSMLYGFHRNNSTAYRTPRIRGYALLQADYAGKEVAMEVAEWIHAVSDCQFLMSYYMKKPRVLHMRNFLGRDFFGLGMVAGRHIRKIRIELHRTLLRDHFTSLKHNLKGLLLCRGNRGLSINIMFIRGTSAVDVLNFLRILRATYMTLRAEGVCFDISYERKLRVRNPVHGQRSSIYKYISLNEIFALPQSSWPTQIIDKCRGVGELWHTEKEWLVKRQKKGDVEDIWANKGICEEGLKMLSKRGKDVWKIE
ncbi:hypothetical protein N0V90_006023 [Kalmusia sp. IMI 367209]|nr:hypothetical protein N0V90_006023 [Kalmusia sp. IMI 367209]